MYDGENRLKFAKPSREKNKPEVFRDWLEHYAIYSFILKSLLTFEKTSGEYAARRLKPSRTLLFSIESPPSRKQDMKRRSRIGCSMQCPYRLACMSNKTVARLAILSSTSSIPPTNTKCSQPLQFRMGASLVVVVLV